MPDMRDASVLRQVSIWLRGVFSLLYRSSADPPLVILVSAFVNSLKSLFMSPYSCSVLLARSTVR